MHFRIEQRIDHPLGDVEAALLDPAFLTELARLPRLGGIELLDQSRQGEVVRRQVRYAFAGDLPGAVTAVVDPARLTWVEDATIDLATHVTEFVIRPDHYADRLRSRGTFTLEEEGDGTLRVAEGELKVSFPLVGGRVERAIVSGMREHAEVEAGALDRWIAQPR